MKGTIKWSNRIYSNGGEAIFIEIMTNTSQNWLETNKIVS